MLPRILLKYEITKKDTEFLRERERLAAASEVNLSLAKHQKKKARKTLCILMCLCRSGLRITAAEQRWSKSVG